jgi:hypothetical protein
MWNALYWLVVQMVASELRRLLVTASSAMARVALTRSTASVDAGNSSRDLISGGSRAKDGCRY